MDRSHSPDILCHATLEGLINRRRAQRLELGRTARQATEDVLLSLSQLGPIIFKRGVEVLRARGLIHRREDIYYGGSMHIGIWKDRHGPGRVIETPEDLAQDRISCLVQRTIGEITWEAGKVYCPLCVKALGRDTVVLIFPCGHWFDVQCLTEWFLRPTNCCCPMCRRPLGASAEDAPSVDDGFVYKSEEYVADSDSSVDGTN